jgi:CBS domain-containing protein
MKIKDRTEFKSKPSPLAFKAHDKVVDAVRAMSDNNYGASVIVDNENRPIGIITERDLMKRLLYKNLDVNTTTVSEVMTSEIRLASENDEVVTWLSIMSNERFRHLPVIDQEGRLISLMSQGDFVSYTWPQLLKQATDSAFRVFMNRFHFHLLFGAILLYGIIMAVLIRTGAIHW